MPFSVLLAMKRNADARILFNAMYPFHVCIERYWGTFDIECFFSTLVREAGQYKPDAVKALLLMDRADLLASITLLDNIDRGFYMPPPRRGGQSQYGGDTGTYAGRGASWVRDETEGELTLPKLKSDKRRLNHAIIKYALLARDFAKCKHTYFSKAN